MFMLYRLLAVDRLLQYLTNSKEPLGGKIMLLAGDFHNVLPHILRVLRAPTVASL